MMHLAATRVLMDQVLNVHNSDIPPLCQACEARHRGVCGALDPQQLVALAKTSSKRRVTAGAELIGDSEQVESYSNVLSGVVKLSKTLSDGRQQIVGLQFAPDFLGQPFKAESALNVEAATNVSLCSFPKAAMDRMIAQSPGLEHRLLQQTLKELDGGARLDGDARAQDRCGKSRELPADDCPQHRSDRGSQSPQRHLHTAAHPR